MKERTPISGSELYLLLNREFKRRQGPGCDPCYVQFPYRVGRRHPDEPNWELLLPATCVDDCRGVLEALVEEFAAIYELAPDR